MFVLLAGPQTIETIHNFDNNQHIFHPAPLFGLDMVLPALLPQKSSFDLRSHLATKGHSPKGRSSPLRRAKFSSAVHRSHLFCGILFAGSLAKRISPRAKDQRQPVEIEEDLHDPRLAIYKTCESKESLQYGKELQEEALRRAGASSGTPCYVDVHYSWVCLERLQQALEIGRCITVGSVLVPEGVSSEELELSAKCSPLVFRAKSNLIDAGLAIKGSRKNFCRFAVAYPVSMDLSKMQAPFIVIDQIASSHCLGQILRTAYHFGIDSVILSQAAWQFIDSRAMRVSVGWGYHMVFHLASSLPNTLQRLQSRGINLFSISEDPSVGKIAPTNESWALLLGCDSLELQQSKVRVPCQMPGMLDIAHAAAIAIYELSGLSSLNSSRAQSGTS